MENYTINWWDEPTTKKKSNWWDDPTDEELEEEYTSSVKERCVSYAAFAGSYD